MYNNQGNSNWNNNGKSPFDDDFNKQRRLEQERKKLGYKKDAEKGFDEIVATLKDAEQNQTEVIINERNKAPIVRYFKRYWDNKFISLSLLVMIAIGILSFYTKLASLGIFIVLIFKYLYSQSSYTRYFLNDHNITKSEIKDIESLIFKNRLDFSKLVLISTLLVIVSFISSFYSINIFIEPLNYEKLINFLSKFGNFDITSELYSYVNMTFVVVLIVLKTIEKWRK